MNDHPNSAGSPSNQGRPPVVTISASYGAGGGFIAPRVADRLGVRFWDRAIPAEVAAALAERPEEVLAVETDLQAGFARWISFFSPTGAAWTGIPAPAVDAGYDEASYKTHIAEVIRREAKRGAVFLGRGAAIVLAQCPDALHVRLDGPAERRIGQAIDLGGLDERSARRAQHQSGTARQRYIRRLYHTDVAEHRHYHLWVDSTAVPFATCVQIIVDAVRGRDELRRLAEPSNERR